MQQHTPHMVPGFTPDQNHLLRMGCGLAGAVGQQGLLPKPTDSRLWLLEVRPGSERRLVVSIMAKATKQTLFIKSVFMQDHLAVAPQLIVQSKQVLGVSVGVTGQGRQKLLFIMSVFMQGAPGGSFSAQGPGGHAQARLWPQHESKGQGLQAGRPQPMVAEPSRKRGSPALDMHVLKHQWAVTLKSGVYPPASVTDSTCGRAQLCRG